MIINSYLLLRFLILLFCIILLLFVLSCLAFAQGINSQSFSYRLRFCHGENRAKKAFNSYSWTYETWTRSRYEPFFEETDWKSPDYFENFVPETSSYILRGQNTTFGTFDDETPDYRNRNNTCRGNACSAFAGEWGRLKTDYRNCYSRDSLYNLLAATGLHAVISNTSMDQHFRNWYQDDVRSRESDNLSSFFKGFGEGAFWIPIMGATDFVYRYGQSADWFARPTTCWGEFASRTTRTYLVGGPTILLGQVILGCSRPSDYEAHHSAWRPFNDNNSFSGHAFIGATPFLVAAHMSERRWCKVAFFALSTFPAWTRINDDDHYLSQAILGWYVSYLAVRAVHKTEGVWQKRGLTVFPLVYGDTAGIGFTYRR